MLTKLHLWTQTHRQLIIGYGLKLHPNCSCHVFVCIRSSVLNDILEVNWIKFSSRKCKHNSRSLSDTSHFLVLKGVIRSPVLQVHDSRLYENRIALASGAQQMFANLRVCNIISLAAGAWRVWAANGRVTGAPEMNSALITTAAPSNTSSTTAG